MRVKSENGDPLLCSFCGNTQEEVRRLVQGQAPGVFICNDCVELWGELLKEQDDFDDDFDDIVFTVQKLKN